MGSSVILPVTGQPAAAVAGEFRSGSQPNVVTFGFVGIGPPSPLYIQRDDQLVIEATSSSASPDTIQFIARLLLPVAPAPGQPSSGTLAAPAIPTQGAYISVVQSSFAAGASGGFTVKTFPLAEGYLLSLAVAATAGQNQRGADFVRAWINRGPTQQASPNAALMLLADYVTTQAPIGWPYGRVVFPTEGPGNLRSFQVGSPAAGADWTTLMPINVRWRICSVNAVLNTNATVVNRIPRIQIQDAGGHLVWQGAPSAVVPASQVNVNVSAGPGQVTITTDTNTVNCPLPSPCILPASCRIQSSTTNLQGTDTWSSIFMMLEEWVDQV